MSLALYVHFPFCTHRCHYCDFSVRQAAEPPIGEWIQAIARDLDDWRAAPDIPDPLRFDSVYLGGGTPSLLGAGGMSGFRQALDSRVVLTETAEFTAEANPISFGGDVARGWREAGVTRVSLGVQSFANGPLEWLGRLHDSAGAIRAVQTAVAAEFQSVNVDLIFGLPAALDRNWDQEIGTLLELGVPHVSTYGLTAEPRTPLGRRVDRGRVRLAEDTAYEAEYLALTEALHAAGFRQYEVSNFAHPHHESRHNWHYWERRSYLGIGPSAHSFLNPRRVWNVYRWEAYRTAAKTGEPLREGDEMLSQGQARLEEIWLGLRTRTGLSRTHPVWTTAGAGQKLGAWGDAGWLVERGDRIVLTPQGYLRMDAVVGSLELDWNGADAEIPPTRSESETEASRT